MTQTYERVLITNIWDTKEKGLSQIPVFTEEEYMKQLKIQDKSQGGLCELVGLKEYQVKPYFDLDPKGEFDYAIFDEFEKDIKRIYYDLVAKEGIINVGEREPREEEWRGNQIIKHSRRYYLNAKISYFNIPIVFKDLFEKYKDIVDTSVYTSNRRLFTPLSQRKRNLIVPQLKVIKGSLFGCCATYIEEEFEDLDLKVVEVKPEIKKVIKQPTDDTCSEFDEDDNNLYGKIKNVIKRLSKTRSDGFDSWIRVCWAIGNIGLKGELRRGKIEELIHSFSKLSSNYNEDTVDTWIDKNLDNIKEQSYGWNYLYYTCIKEDDPKYFDNITKSYYLMKKEFEVNNAKILYPPMIVHTNRQGDNVLQTVKSCKETNAHVKCKVKTINKKEEVVYVEKKFIDLWLEDATIRRYDNYVFKPPNNSVEDYEYNSWIDFKIKQTLFVENEEVINRWLEYMKNLFNDDNVVQYIIAYFANRLQNPANRNKVSIVIYGEEGDGKNRLCDIFKNIFGENYYTELESAKQMFGSHSCIEKEKLFVCVNEAKGKDNYENADILKARITTDTLMVNPKGIQEFKIDNHCDYIMTTNNANAVNIHDKSRRFLLVETTSYYSRNSEFFNKFSNDIVENPKALRVIYEYLMKFDVKLVVPSGNFQNHIPETEIQKVVIQSNKDKILCFLEDLASTCQIDDDEKAVDISNEVKYSNNVLFQRWIRWIETNRHDLRYNNISFHTRLALLMKKKINTKGVIIRKDTRSNTFIDFVKLMEFIKTEN